MAVRMQSRGSLFNIEYERTDALEDVLSKLEWKAGFFEHAGDRSYGRISMGAQSKQLQVLIRRNAPKSTGRYLAQSLRVDPSYSPTPPYASFSITALTKGARQYWIQREARTGLIVDKRQYRAEIRGKSGKRWLYIPVPGTKVWRMAQGYDYRKVGEGAMDLARKAGYPFTRFVKDKSVATNKALVWGYRNARDYKLRRLRKKSNPRLLFVAKYSVRQKPFQKGRYIGPSVEQQTPKILASVSRYYKIWLNSSKRESRRRRR